LILYLDTSSLVKLYISEVHSSLVEDWVEKAEIIATCRVAYPEMMSALNRRFRSGDLTKKDYDLVAKHFSDEWRRFAILEFDEIRAGSLAAMYGLRGFDAVHLSAALLLNSSKSEPEMAFSSFDQKLNEAASAEKMKVFSSISS
jgi:predicted nucleic acid-binding protein